MKTTLNIVSRQPWVNTQRKNVQLMPEQLARQKMLLSLWKILLPLTPLI
jgi:hypothetical protein